MTFIITGGCCNDSSCVPVCPVQCIRPRPGDPDFQTSSQLYIDPGTCIDCAACVDQCPLDAIYSEWELPESLQVYAEINAEHFSAAPIVPSMAPRPARRTLPAGAADLRVAIVGSGPAGAYAAEELAQIPGARITILDRLPTPGGLIRSGVAPDHQATKRIGERFERLFRRANVDCFFNVEVGSDLDLTDLLAHHHAVIWAGGLSADRQLGIPGEDLVGAVSAREFVAWYNGHPDHQDRDFDLWSPLVVVVGNGNVAMDVARMLTTPVESLSHTDIAPAALEAFGRSGTRQVEVVARRGPGSAACTFAEVLGIADSPDLRLVTRTSELQELGDRPDDRLAQLLLAASETTPEPGSPSIVMRFGLRPTAINGHRSVESITFEAPDGSQEIIETRLVIKAVGYLGEPISGLPFDTATATLPHESGAVVDPATGARVAGVYCTGWIKRGPNGVIGTNRPDARETVETLLDDHRSGALPDPEKGPVEFAGLIGERCPDAVDKQGWQRINQTEHALGAEQGRDRVKLTSWDALLTAAEEPVPHS